MYDCTYSIQAGSAYFPYLAYISETIPTMGWVVIAPNPTKVNFLIGLGRISGMQD